MSDNKIRVLFAEESEIRDSLAGIISLNLSDNPLQSVHHVVS